MVKAYFYLDPQAILNHYLCHERALHMPEREEKVCCCLGSSRCDPSRNHSPKWAEKPWGATKIYPGTTHHKKKSHPQRVNHLFSYRKPSLFGRASGYNVWVSLIQTL